jgi:hypothetical protein
MKQLPKEIIKNGIHYTLRGDYYFPDLNLPEVPLQTIGRYGRMRKAYLEEHRPGLYTRLILSGKLYSHLLETDLACRDRMERMISRMAEAEGINEQLKASDQLGWISRMNNIHQRAEEIILDELVFA